MKRNILIGLAVLLSACTASQQAAIDAAISKNLAAVQSVCASKIIPAAESPLTMMALAAADSLPFGGDLTMAVNYTVATCNNLTEASLSATTVPWLESLLPVIQGAGKVSAPAPIAPAPVTAATVIPTVAVSP